MQHGGADVSFDDDGRRIGGALLLAVVTLSDDTVGRQYRLAYASDYQGVWNAHRRLKEVIAGPLVNGFSPVPGETSAVHERNV